MVEDPLVDLHVRPDELNAEPRDVREAAQQQWPPLKVGRLPVRLPVVPPIMFEK